MEPKSAGWYVVPGGEMSPMRNVDPEESAAARFAYELRRYRLMVGLTQVQLGRRIGYSASMIGAVETLQRTPSLDMAELCDKAFGLDGVLVGLHLEAWPPPLPVPERFREWMAVEQRATAIRMWDFALIPGLFQTEAYARAVFGCSPGITPEQLEERVRHRMERKTLLAKGDPPMIFSLIDEMVLRRPRGGPTVMREQLLHLYEIAQHPRVKIQIVPFEAEGPVTDPAFVISEHQGVPFGGYVESIPDGRTTSDRGVIGALVARYDAIRAEAYPQSLSLEKIKEVLERWT